MAYFGSFALAGLVPFVLGFALTGFWRRWAMLLPIGAGVLIVGLVEYRGALSGDGPGVGVGVLLCWFFILGTVCGIVASGALMIGHDTRSEVLRPFVVIPVIFAIGFGGPMAYYFAEAVASDVRKWPPAPECFQRLYPARIAGVDLSLPAAPGVSYLEAKSNKLVGMWHNPDLRSLCSQSADQTTEIRVLIFMLHESSWSTPDAKNLFCSRRHPEYQWAEMVCDPKASNRVVLNRPQFVQIEVIDPKGSPAEKPVAAPDFPMAISPDGSKIYRSGDDMVIVTPDGDRAECSGIARNKYLDCHARGKLTAELSVYYSFRTTRDGIEQTIPEMKTATRSYFQSLMR